MSANPSNQSRRRFAAAVWTLLGVAALILAERRINGGLPLSLWLSLPATGLAILASLCAFTLHASAKTRQLDLWPIALTVIFPAAIAGALISIQSAVGATFVAIAVAASVVAILAIRGEGNIALLELQRERAATAFVRITRVSVSSHPGNDENLADASQVAVIEELSSKSEFPRAGFKTEFDVLGGRAKLLLSRNSESIPIRGSAGASPSQSFETASNQTAAEPVLAVAASTFLLADALEQECEPAVSQWLKRFHTADGSERIEGELSVRIPEGQLHETVHIPFSPPFSRPPHIECELTNGDAARAKIAAVYPFGARIEIKRPSAASECTVRLAFFADSQRKQVDAA